MSKTTLGDLNEYLFERLDALSNEDLDELELEKEIKRSKATTDVSKTIIDNARVILDAQKHADEYGYGAKERKLPEVLKIEEK